MIIFDLNCNEGHGFEGWFRSQEDFDRQMEEGLISCPFCGSLEVRRVPSAVHLSAAPEKTPATTGHPVINPQGAMLETFRKLVSSIVSNSEDVGKDFASEARKIHYMEAPERSIRGEATAEEFASLQEEGIEIFRLPVMKKENMN